MRKNNLLPAAILLLLPIFACAQQETVDTAMMQRIKDEETQHSQITFIAHNITDVCGPRLTNSPGYKRAVDWTVSQLKSWGLTAAPEAWGEFGKGWSNEETYISLKKPYYENIVGYAKAWSGSTKGKITAGIVVLDKLDSAHIKAKAAVLKGKAVMVKTINGLLHAPSKGLARYADTELNKLPDTYMIPSGMLQYYIKVLADEYAAQKYLATTGAVALVSSSGNSRDGTVYVDGTPGYAKGYEVSLPEIVIAEEDYLKLQRLAEDNKDPQLELDIKNNWYNDDINGYNVIGEMPGTDPSLKAQVVMLGGHLDSWHTGTGATDNAAGCIVMMEAVRILKALGVQPRRTIRIALWGGEEQGLLGSFGYVKKHYGNPMDMKLSAEQKDVSVYFNLDNGSGKIRGIYLQNNEKARPIFESWLKPFADMGAIGITGSNTGSTDHLSFDAVGIPGYQFIQDPLEYETRTHHSNMDVFDHLYIDDLKQAATVVAGFIYNAAMRDEMMPRKPLPKPERFVFDTDLPL